MKLYCNAFWSGFYGSPACMFFVELLSRTLDCRVELASQPESADILLESHFGPSARTLRPWTYTVFFSGECRACPNMRSYDCMLWGEATEDNVVCCPLFVVNIYCEGWVDRIEGIPSAPPLPLPPTSRVCAVVSNPGGRERNLFMDVLDQQGVPVDYAGRYRTNVPPLEAEFTSDEFFRAVGQYRCVLAMENSRGGHYVTEKILHGILAGNVPIYWGAANVASYFNPDRMIHVAEMTPQHLEAALEEIQRVLTDDEAFQAKVSQPVFVDASGNPSHQLPRTMDDIVVDMRRLLVKG